MKRIAPTILITVLTIVIMAPFNVVKAYDNAGSYYVLNLDNNKGQVFIANVTSDRPNFYKYIITVNLTNGYSGKIILQKSNQFTSNDQFVVENANLSTGVDNKSISIELNRAWYAYVEVYTANGNSAWSIINNTLTRSTNKDPGVWLNEIMTYENLQNSKLTDILNAIKSLNPGSGDITIESQKEWFRDYTMTANGFIQTYTRSNAVLNSNGQYTTQPALATMQDSLMGYVYKFANWNTRDSFYTHARSFSVLPKTTNYLLVMTNVRFMANDGSNKIYPQLYTRFNNSSFTGSNWGKATNWTIDYIDRNGSYLIYLFTIKNETEELQDISIDFGYSTFDLIPLYLGSNYNVPEAIEELTKIDSEDKYTKLLKELNENIKNISFETNEITFEEIIAAVNENTNTNKELKETTKEYKKLESDFQSNFNNALNEIDIDTINNQIESIQNGVTWWREQMDNIYSSMGLIGFALILPLIIAIALMMIGV